MERTPAPQGRLRQTHAYDSEGRATVEGPEEARGGEGSSLAQRPLGGPEPYGLSPMAYDNNRGVTVMVERGVTVTRTWEWNGAAWSLESTSGPAPRYGHAIVFDSRRGVVVLFGGIDAEYGHCVPGLCGYPTFGDTWEWDGTTWELRGTNGPSPRSYHAMAFDSDRGVTVLHGGQERYVSPWEPDVVGDTWEWDGTTWALRTTDGPHPRSGHAMAFDSARGVAVMFGGFDYDTWEWDGTTWTDRTNVGPWPRLGAAMAYDSARGVTVLFGGYDGMNDGFVYFDDTHEWDGSVWRLRAASGPEGEWLISMAFDSLREVMVLTTDRETWEYGCDSDCQPTIDAPVREVEMACEDLMAPWMPCHADKNRYLSFRAPTITCDSDDIALKVTLSSMPGPFDCPGVPDYQSYAGREMWVGPEVLLGDGTPTGVHGLQPTPLFLDWTTVDGGIVHVSDCNIVPCATYTIEAIAGADYPSGNYSPPLALSTGSAWGDIVGIGNQDPPFGELNVLDVAAVVDCVKEAPGAPPASWCDVFGNTPSGGADGRPDVLDVATVVDALKGADYPFGGPTAPAACDGAP